MVIEIRAAPSAPMAPRSRTTPPTMMSRALPVCFDRSGFVPSHVTFESGYIPRDLRRTSGLRLSPHSHLPAPCSAPSKKQLALSYILLNLKDYRHAFRRDQEDQLRRFQEARHTSSFRRHDHREYPETSHYSHLRQCGLGSVLSTRLGRDRLVVVSQCCPAALPSGVVSCL